MSTDGQGERKAGSAGGEHCHVEVTCVPGLVQHVDGRRVLPPKRARVLPPKRGKAQEWKLFLGVTWVGSRRGHGDF